MFASSKTSNIQIYTGRLIKGLTLNRRIVSCILFVTKRATRVPRICHHRHESWLSRIRCHHHERWGLHRKSTHRHADGSNSKNQKNTHQICFYWNRIRNFNQSDVGPLQERPQTAGTCLKFAATPASSQGFTASLYQFHLATQPHNQAVKHIENT